MPSYMRARVQRAYSNRHVQLELGSTGDASPRKQESSGDVFVAFFFFLVMMSWFIGSILILVFSSHTAFADPSDFQQYSFSGDLQTYTTGSAPPALVPNECLVECAAAGCGDVKKPPCQSHSCPGRGLPCTCTAPARYPAYSVAVLTGTSSSHLNCSALMAGCLSRRQCACGLDGSHVKLVSTLAFAAGLVALVSPVLLAGFLVLLDSHCRLNDKAKARLDQLAPMLMVALFVVVTAFVVSAGIVVAVTYHDAVRDGGDGTDAVLCGASEQLSSLHTSYILCFVVVGAIAVGGTVGVGFQAMQNLAKRRDRAKCDEIFDMCDKNKDGLLDFGEACWLTRITNGDDVESLTAEAWTSLCGDLGGAEKLTKELFYKSYTDHGAGDIATDYEKVKKAADAQSASR